jgi:hypothetical protein
MRKLVACLLALVLLVSVGCMAHVHKVGAGASAGDSASQRQWYILWGIVPLNNVDSNQMAAGASNYEIKTSFTPVDFIINIFTGVVTVGSRTVTVTK